MTRGWGRERPVGGTRLPHARRPARGWTRGSGDCQDVRARAGGLLQAGRRLGDSRRDGGLTKARKIRLGLLFGGRSPEHEISITTAASIAKEADPERIEIVPIYISRGRGAGCSYSGSEPLAALAGKLVEEREIGPLQRREVLLSGAADGGLVPVRRPAAATDPESGTRARDRQGRSRGSPAPIDVLFPALHGQGGEDGSVQGLARLAGLPCVGRGDPRQRARDGQGLDEADRGLASGSRFPITSPSRASDWQTSGRRDPRRDRGAPEPIPVFVKPSGAGSSVGITKIHDHGEARRRGSRRGALRLPDARRGGNRRARARGRPPRQRRAEGVGRGGDRPGREFYDYRAKYMRRGEPRGDPRGDPEGDGRDRPRDGRSGSSARSICRDGARRLPAGPAATGTSTSTRSTRSRASRRSACTRCSGRRAGSATGT